jgi:hypothetical protein
MRLETLTFGSEREVRSGDIPIDSTRLDFENQIQQWFKERAVAITLNPY